jgi:ABC-type multidrug transport system fused ATPase/permease subunit
MTAAGNAASETLKLLDSVPEIDAYSTSGKNLDEKTVSGRIDIKDVHFRYPTRPEIPVLRGLSLSIEPGTFIALAGASGSGKSTMCANLICACDGYLSCLPFQYSVDRTVLQSMVRPNTRALFSRLPWPCLILSSSLMVKLSAT